MEKKKVVRKMNKMKSSDTLDSANEPEERESATLEDMAHVDADELKEKVVYLEQKNQLEEAINWAFEKPAEALFVGLSSVMSQANPEVKKRVIEFIKLPPQDRLEKVLGSSTFKYLKARMPSSMER